MAFNVKKFSDPIKDLLAFLVELGLALVLVFLIVDILFPGTFNIVDNLMAVLESFTGKGVVGLIALLIFIGIYNK